jgi:KUP system potassium uptake protein
VNKNFNKATPLGLIIALGIVYGDLGTSPLYVFNAIIRDKIITPQLVLGGLSCIIWTLTLQTTIKYITLTLKADNNGEGGIFSLYALIRRQKKWLVFPAMIGGAAIMADGMITPPITVTSAVEGLKQIPFFQRHQRNCDYLYRNRYFTRALFFTTIWNGQNRKALWPDHVFMVPDVTRFGVNASF